MRLRPAITPRPDGGFTLMELMIVLVLIAILTAMILPEMRGTYEDALLRSAGRQFIDGSSLASSRAVALSQTHRLRLDRGVGRYVLERQVGRKHRAAQFEPVDEASLAGSRLDPRVRWMLRPSGGERGSVGMNPAGERARASENLPDSVRFYADGTADAAELWLEDRMGVRLALKVSPATGRVRVTESPSP